MGLAICWGWRLEEGYKAEAKLGSKNTEDLNGKC